MSTLLLIILLFLLDLLLAAGVFELANIVRIQFLTIDQIKASRIACHELSKKIEPSAKVNVAPVATEKPKLVQAPSEKPQVEKHTVKPVTLFHVGRKSDKKSSARLNFEKQRLEEEKRLTEERLLPGGFFSEKGRQMFEKVKTQDGAKSMEDSFSSEWGYGTETEEDGGTPLPGSFFSQSTQSPYNKTVTFQSTPRDKEKTELKASVDIQKEITERIAKFRQHLREDSEDVTAENTSFNSSTDF